jgi:WS/DGAT/MGAT family acyltransferase
MTAADAFFLAADRPQAPQVIGGLVLLSGSDGLDAAAAAASVADALRASSQELPLLREVLHPALPRWLRRPLWRPGDPPALDAVRQHVLPDDDDVRRQVAALLAEPLDLRRRPWSLDVFAVPAGAPGGPDGVAPARVTVLFRLHHSFTDGLGVISLTRGLFDEGRATRGAGQARRPPERRRIGQPRRPTRPDVERWVAAASRAATSAAGLVRGVAGLAARGAAPTVPWQGRMSGARSLEVVELPLAATHAQAKSLGVGMTALVAAAVAEGLLRAPEVARAVERGTLRHVRAMLPVAVRSAGTWDSLGNHTAGVPLDIPLTPATLAERAQAVQQQLSAAGQEQQARSARLVVAGVPRLLPPAVHRLLVRAVYGPRWFSLVVTALPGPRQRQHIGHQVVRGVGGILPLPPGVALTVGALRWTDTLTVTLLADPAAFPDPASLRDGVAALDPAVAAPAPSLGRPA